MEIEQNEQGEAVRITMPRWFDAHLHLRHGEMLRNVLPFSAAYCDRAVVMPNLKRHEGDAGVLTGEDMAMYRAEILRAVDGLSGEKHQLSPLMTIKIADRTTPEMVTDALREGAVAGKAYPTGVTTNAEEGVSDFKRLWPVFKTMQDIGMMLCLHGTVPRKKGSKITLAGERAREERFLPTLLAIHTAFPRLKIVLEHVTTQKAADLITELPETVGATVTVHHLFLLFYDVFKRGKMRQSHHFCEPVAKGERDREALRRMVLSGDPHFFLGTDSAPHPELEKQWVGEKQGKPGSFTAPLPTPFSSRSLRNTDIWRDWGRLSPGLV